MLFEISALKVQEYDKWKTGFDGLKSILKENGAICRRIFRDIEDPNKVMIIIVWENLESLNKLAKEKALLAEFQKLGILEVDIHHFKEIENKKL